MYYYIANVQNKKFEVLRQCSEEEYKRIEQLQEPIKIILFSANRRIDPLKRAYKKISTINIALMKQTGEYNQYDLGDAISGFLFQLRKYLDNWETYLKRECKETPERLKAFTEATHKAYDEHIEYQIVYRLRNVDQHCDSIIQNLRMGIAEDGAIYIEAKTKCSYLLSVSSDWKPDERKHLEEHDEIDLFKYISVTYRCIEEIHQATLNSFFSLELYENCYKIIGCANEFFDKREGLKFFCQEEELTKEFWERPQKTLNMQDWMVRECINLLTLFIRNNTSVAIVLYHGSFPCDFIDSFATNLDKEEEKNNIQIGSLIRTEKWAYRCYSKKIDLQNDASIIVAVNTALQGDKEKEIADQIGRFLDVLVWKSQLEE